MGLACKITGHKWNGCVCTRCGEERNEGHDYQLTVVKGDRSWINLNPQSTCMEVCSICGRRHEAEHDWDGCRCTRCDAKRDQGHTWGEPFSKSSTHHSVRCLRCGKIESSPHTFKRVKGGVQRCTECGFELKSKPKFASAAQESDYYAKLIASGEVGYYDLESERRLVKYGDHVTTIPALTRLFIALADNNGADNYAPEGIARKLNDIASERPEEAGEVGAAFAQIACDERVHIYWRSWVAEHDWIKDPELLEEARKSVARWHEAHHRSQADIDYENAMIASDSGLYTTG